MLIKALFAGVLVVAFSFAAVPVSAGDAEDKARKAFAEWKAAKEAVAAAKEKLAGAQKTLQNAMTAVAKSGGNPTSEQEAALAKGRAEVAEAEAALQAAERQELAARIALESAIAELPDGPLKDQLKRERNFPSLAAANGLYTVKFDTPGGQLIVSLPDDMRAGDTVSGTVATAPKGSSEEESNRNRNVLNGYLVQIGDQKFPVNGLNVGPIVVPKAPSLPIQASSFFDVFVVVDLPTGTLLGPARIPLLPPGAETRADPKTTPSFIIPPLGQNGRPVVIPGPFDGNSSNTALNSSNTDQASGKFRLLAESPRKAIFESPANVAGPISITVNERGAQTSGNYRNVSVNLSAPKTNLLKGEKTELRVEVTGLQGLKTPVPLTLKSHGVIAMEGGSYQPLVIQPSEVTADGRYSTTRGITGVQAGGWNAIATVVTRPFDFCLQDDSAPARVVLWNTSTGNYLFPASGSNLNGTGKVALKGCIITLTHNAPDRRVFARLDACSNTGSASVQATQSPEPKFTITDRNTEDNTCSCSPECK